MPKTSSSKSTHKKKVVKKTSQKVTPKKVMKKTTPKKNLLKKSSQKSLKTTPKKVMKKTTPKKKLLKKSSQKSLKTTPKKVMKKTTPKKNLLKKSSQKSLKTTPKKVMKKSKSKKSMKGGMFDGNDIGTFVENLKKKYKMPFNEPNSGYFISSDKSLLKSIDSIFKVLNNDSFWGEVEQSEKSEFKKNVLIDIITAIQYKVNMTYDEIDLEEAKIAVLTAAVSLKVTVDNVKDKDEVAETKTAGDFALKINNLSDLETFLKTALEAENFADNFADNVVNKNLKKNTYLLALYIYIYAKKHFDRYNLSEKINTIIFKMFFSDSDSEIQNIFYKFYPKKNNQQPSANQQSTTIQQSTNQKKPPPPPPPTNNRESTQQKLSKTKNKMN
jgi:hypothetical protein